VLGERSVNTRERPAYLRRIEAGEPATGPQERLEPEARARETAMLMLRRTILGIDRADFALRTGFSVDDLLGQELRRFVGEGLLEDDGRRLKLSGEGIFLADRVFCELV
jgi:oxygen-independent coproporphyrinogen-3 oxidase